MDKLSIMTESNYLVLVISEYISNWKGNDCEDYDGNLVVDLRII